MNRRVSLGRSKRTEFVNFSMGRLSRAGSEAGSLVCFRGGPAIGSQGALFFMELVEQL